MSLDPYRTPARPDEMPTSLPRGASYDIAVAATLVWGLGVMRVIFALARSEAPSRDIDLAWLFVLLAPFVVWKELAAHEKR